MTDHESLHEIKVHHTRCQQHTRIPIHSSKNEQPFATSNLSTKHFTPQQLAKAYNVTGTNLGQGITVAVVVAYAYANLQTDFDLFCSTFNLPSQTLQIITMPNQTVTSSSVTTAWEREVCLDIQMVHAVAPYASIVVIQASSSKSPDLYSAVSQAVALNVDIVSMSWGTAEYSNEILRDTSFSNSNICFVASAGDSSDLVTYPSCSPNVLCVGGTTLSLTYDSNGNIVTRSEIPWTNGGCGVSVYESMPSCQSSILKTGTGTTGTVTGRNCVDVSLVASPGVYIIHQGQLDAVNGTSLSAPYWAGILAICNQARVANNKSKLTTLNGHAQDVKAMLYGVYNTTSYSNVFYDITSGVNGMYSATTGYDLPCGLGTPKINSLIGLFTSL